MLVNELEVSHFERVKEMAKLSEDVSSLKAEISNLTVNRETLIDEAKKLAEIEIRELLRHESELMNDIQKSTSDVETFISWTKNQLKFIEECNDETSKLISAITDSYNEISEFLEEEKKNIEIQKHDIALKNEDIQRQKRKIEVDRDDIEKQRIEILSKRKALSNAYKTLRK